MSDSGREYVGDRPVVIGTAEKPLMFGFTDAEIEKARLFDRRTLEKFGEQHRVEIVSTHDLKPGDLVWTGQDFNIVRATKMQSEIEDGHVLANQCVVLWRDLPEQDRDQYHLKGYTAFGDVILRVVTHEEQEGGDVDELRGLTG